MLDDAVMKECTEHTRVFPTPEYTPSIYKSRSTGTTRSFPLPRPSRSKPNPASRYRDFSIGRPSPRRKRVSTSQETHSQTSPDSMDVEAIVRLSDGTFWISEEMAPSIAHVAADGRVLRRIVPAGAAGDYADAEAEIADALPAILSRRHINRGIEGLALSPDERSLYFIMQSALDNEGRSRSRATRGCSDSTFCRARSRPSTCTGSTSRTASPSANPRSRRMWGSPS